MDGRAKQTIQKYSGIKLKLEVFLKSSTAHHHPDEFCHERRRNTSESDPNKVTQKQEQTSVSAYTSSLLKLLETGTAQD